MSKELFEFLQETESLEYGAVFPASVVHDFLGLEYPAMSTKAVFDKLELIELSAISYVRNRLLNSGMYLAKTGAQYRILLPSENRVQVDKYLNSASGKLRRALKLSKNTPTSPWDLSDEEARIRLHQDSVNRAADHQKLLG